MTYQKTQWENGVTPINDDNLNHGETQYDEAMKDVLAGFAPLGTQKIASMSEAWAGDKVTAQASARVAYEDAIASSEAWASLGSNWKFTAGKLQVSGGRLYAGDTTGGTTYGAVGAYDLGTLPRGVIKTNVSIPATGTDSGDLIVGISDEFGVTPTVSGGRAKGVAFQPAADGTFQIQLWDLGTRTQIGTYVPGQTYYVTITWDTISTSVTVTQANSTYAFNGVLALSGFTPRQRYVFNADRRAAAGKSIGQMGLMTALASNRTRAGIEDLSPFWAHISDNSTYRLHIALPSSYDSRKPSPVLLCFHGAGTDAANYGSGNNNNSRLMSTFTAAGFIVVSASLNANRMTWGSDAGLAVYEYAYQYLKSFFSIGSIAFHANSMGGIESLLTLARNKIPCAVWTGWNPTASLKNNYVRGTYASQITASYGIAADGSNFDAVTAGHDPAVMAGTAFRGVPMMVIEATDDTNVPAPENWDILEANVLPYAADYSRVPVTGGHGSTQLGDNAPNLLAFVKRYIGNVLS